MTKRVMILATDGFEQSELIKPKANLEKAGIETEVVSLEEGSIRGWDQKDWGESVAVDKTVDAIENCDGYGALLLPGGQMNPDILRMSARSPSSANSLWRTNRSRQSAMPRGCWRKRA